MRTPHTLQNIAVATLFPIVATANDLSGKPFSLRIPAAFSHLSYYGDVSAKSGASAASKWSSSPNPANKGWTVQEENDWRISGNYNNVSFDNDTQFHFISETVTMDAGAAGVFRLGLLQVSSNDETARGNIPLPFEFGLNGGQLSWGKKLAGNFALGAEVGFTQSQTIFRSSGFDLASTEKNAWSSRVGGLWQPIEKWFIALYGDYVNGSADTILRLPSAFGLSSTHIGETVQQFAIHPGIGFEFTENAMIHADYEAGWVWNSDTTLETHRFAIGTDIPLAKFLYLRAGVAADSKSNLSWSTGIGFYPSKHVFIDLAFQSNAFQELKTEFGRSQTLNASVSFQW